MLRFLDHSSHAKSFPGHVTTTADGIVIGAQAVRFHGDTYDVPETAVPIAWTGEPMRHVVWLTPDGLVHASAPAGEPFPEVDGAVVYLAALILRTETDTPETVDVEVPRVTLVERPGKPLLPPIVHTVPPGLIVPEEPPERAAKRARRVRVKSIRAAVAQKPIDEMTLPELRKVVALIAEEMALDLGAGPMAPKGK